MVQNRKKKLKKMGGPGGGVMVEQIFETKPQKGYRGLGAHFPPHYPGVTPPRIRRTGPPSLGFFKKKN